MMTPYLEYMRRPSLYREFLPSLRAQYCSLYSISQYLLLYTICSF